jgi:peptidoglycan hydrolase-like protein with peptidoglycan-binding domain
VTAAPGRARLFRFRGRPLRAGGFFYVPNMENSMARIESARFLRGAVGAGDLDNRPEDVMSTKRRLRALGLYTPPPEGIGDDIDRGLDEAVRTFQQQQGLRVDGVLTPGGETERNLVAREHGRGIDPGPFPESILPRRPVGEGGENDNADVALIKRAFGALGRYPYDRTRPPPPYIDAKLVDTIRGFQSAHGLFPDGRIDPDGSTVKALRVATAETRAKNGAQDGKGNASSKGTEVAGGPASLLMRLLLSGGRAAAKGAAKKAPDAGKAAGAAATAGAAGQAAMEASKKKGQRYEVIENPPPSSPPPFPREERDPNDNVETFPADGPKMPTVTGFPLAVPEKPSILIFPDQSDELPQATIVHANRTNEKTEQDTLDLQVKVQREHRDWTLEGGGYVLSKDMLNGEVPSAAELTKLDRRNRETALPGPGNAFVDKNGKKGDGRPGSNLPDLLFSTPDGKLVAFQTVDGDKNGKPPKRELDAADAIRKKGVTVFLVVKSRMAKK